MFSAFSCMYVPLNPSTRNHTALTINDAPEVNRFPPNGNQGLLCWWPWSIKTRQISYLTWIAYSLEWALWVCWNPTCLSRKGPDTVRSLSAGQQDHRDWQKSNFKNMDQVFTSLETNSEGLWDCWPAERLLTMSSPFLDTGLIDRQLLLKISHSICKNCPQLCNPSYNNVKIWEKSVETVFNIIPSTSQSKSGTNL